MATLPCHGLKTQNVSFDETNGKNKTDLPTNSKWQIGLFLWLKPYRGGAGTAGGAGAKSETLFARSPSGGSGVLPWRAFGDFPRDGKVTLGAEHGFAMLSRSACRWVQGLPAPHKLPGSEGRSAL